MNTITLNPGYFSQRSSADWAFALLSVLGMGLALFRYESAMDCLLYTSDAADE